MELDQKHSISQTPQPALRQKLETNMDIITDIFKNSMEDDYKTVIPEVIKVYKTANPYLNYERIKHALRFTMEHHMGQGRDSGDQYVIHPVGAGYITAEFGIGEDAIITANLHDIVEENEDKALAMMNSINDNFGQTVYAAVMALSIFDQGEMRDNTKLDAVMTHAKKEEMEWIFHVFIADGIHNLYTKKHMKAKKGMTAIERQQKYAENIGNNILPIAAYLDRVDSLDLELVPYMKNLIKR
jgi:(p)ppGpp synthase/HD superfamily hydrolase